MSVTVAELAGRKYCLVETFRRSGEPMPTPVWFGHLSADRICFRTGAQAGKIKRIRNDGHVRVAPCTARGRPVGPFMEGDARLVDPHEASAAEAALVANYGLGRKLYLWYMKRRSGPRKPTYVEIRLDAG